MKRSISAFFLTLSLFFVQSCSSPRSEETSINSTPRTGETQSMGSEKKTNSGDLNLHNGHSMETPPNSIETQVKLTPPGKITPNNPLTLVIDIQDTEGKSIDKFDTFQEKLMHLIVVSDNLEFFNHLHPNYKGKGRFEVEADFPKSGNYTLFSDYKPTGKTEQVSVLKTQVSGTNPSTPVIDTNRTKSFGDTQVNLTLSPPTLKVGEDVNLIFQLRQTSNNQPITDLQPYLGEQGHLVILKQSSPLTKVDYIHAHAMTDSSPHEIHFMTRFPQPGNYKLWGQFNRNGKIITADFWVSVP